MDHQNCFQYSLSKRYRWRSRTYFENFSFGCSISLDTTFENMKIAIIHSGDVGFVARLMNVFPSEGYDIETFEPTQSNLLQIVEGISDFDPDVVMLEHDFDGFTGYDLAVDSLSYTLDICIGISNDTSQKDYCSFKINPNSNLEDPKVRQSILAVIHSAANV